jgi:hypothetical protein
MYGIYKEYYIFEILGKVFAGCCAVVGVLLIALPVTYLISLI